MNNKGISLVTVIVIIIVMIIIATISIVAGNKLIFEANELKNTQIIETIKEAAGRMKQEVLNSGSITPKGEGLIGRYSPAIANGEVQAVGWYLLDEDALNELGVKDTKGRFLINYDYLEVLDMSDSSYYEKYNVIEFMHEQKALKEEAEKNGTMTSFKYVGLELYDLSSKGSSAEMYKRVKNNQTEIFSDGWYLVHPSDLPENYSNNVNNSYLINYDDSKFVLFDASFEEIVEEYYL